MPGRLLCAIHSFYKQSKSCVCILGTVKREVTFSVCVGRSGCPLSPILFVISMDRISRCRRSECPIWVPQNCIFDLCRRCGSVDYIRQFKSRGVQDGDVARPLLSPITGIIMEVLSAESSHFLLLKRLTLCFTLVTSLFGPPPITCVHTPLC